MRITYYAVDKVAEEIMGVLNVDAGDVNRPVDLALEWKNTHYPDCILTVTVKEN